MNYRQLLKHASVQLTGDLERDLAIIAEAALRVGNQTAQELAEARAYVVCPNCQRLYTEAEWLLLRPASGFVWRATSDYREEHRTCDVCATHLMKVDGVALAEEPQ